MIEYPFNNAVVLTDALYTSYGGWFGNSTPIQRQNAYLLAEMQMTEHLDTPLLITTVTGTYYYPQYMSKLVLDYGHIRSINSIVIQSPNGCDCALQNLSACAFVMDDTYGVILIAEKETSYCVCAQGIYPPFLAEVSYTCGLSSGTSFKPNMLMALTMAASIDLKEMCDPGALESGAGDVGVQSWNSISYSEIRVKLGNSIFGSSPVANKIKRLVSPLRHLRTWSVG